MSLVTAFLLTSIVGFLIFAWATRYAGLTRAERLEEIAASSHRSGMASGGYIPSLSEQAPELMKFAITTILLIAGLYIILSPSYSPADKHWAYGIVGTLVGFWLRPTPPARRLRRPKEK